MPLRETGTLGCEDRFRLGRDHSCFRSAPATFYNAAKLPTAAAAVPMKLRRVNSLIIIAPEGYDFVLMI
jgi:hypothetical protein